MTDRPYRFPLWAGRTATLLVALYLLNFILSFHNVWPTPWIETRHEISIEMTVLLLLLGAWVRHRRELPSGLIPVLATLLTLATLGRYAEVTAPALYGRPVNLYWDARYLPHVMEMLVEAASLWQLLALMVATVMSLAGLYLLLRLALIRVLDGCARQGEYRIVGSLTGLLLVMYVAGYMGLGFRNNLNPFSYSIPVSHTYARQVDFIRLALGAEPGRDPVPAGEPLAALDPLMLGGRDVYVQFLESYGATAFDAPRVAAILRPHQQAFVDQVRAAGADVFSAWVAPPTYGGGSWLSHASFLTGLDIRDNAVHSLLLTRDRQTLAGIFSQAGYRSVALMPGLRAEWPEGGFYRFDNIIGARELDYRGPAFGWWRIPDQYSLAWFEQVELQRPDRAPLFLFNTTITSHMPFLPTPPYQAEWSRILTPSPYADDVLATALSQTPDWLDLQPAYASTLAYTFDYLTGFLQRHHDRDFLWILLGDHQPVAGVSGEGARWEVPVHVVTRDPGIIARLRETGFSSGIYPESPVPLAMHELPSRLLGYPQTVTDAQASDPASNVAVGNRLWLQSGISP